MEATISGKFDIEGERDYSLYGSLIPLITLLAIALPVLIAVYHTGAPALAGPGAAATEFSSARAMERLNVIAQKPRPIGSAEHAKVLNYLTAELSAMGLKPEVQETTAVSRGRSFPVIAATVRNAIVRWQGTDSVRAVLLVAHYDSVSTGSGASDDGSGVTALLETLRALKAGPPLRNDLIFLFTDAEETGLLGAQAFVDESPLLKDVGIVLNFEARGNSGPSIMFETGPSSGWAIRELADSVPYPVASSFSYEIYRRLPNATDLNMFKDAHLPGLNFAYIDGINRYHSELDSLEAIDESSLQHHGSYSLALARRFGNSDFRQTGDSDAIYFNVFSTLIHYSVTWAIPFGAFVSIVFLAVVLFGLRTRQLTVRGIALSFFILLASMTASALAATLIWWIINKAHSRYSLVPGGEPYNGYLYVISFVALSVAITSAIYAKFWTKANVESLAVGGFTWWLILTVASSLYLPGGSYLFTWPLLFSLIALGCVLAARSSVEASLSSVATLSILAIPGILLVVPMIHMVFSAVTLANAAVPAVITVLLLGLLVPQLKLITGSKRWLLPATASLIGLALIVAGSLSSGLDSKHRQTNSLFYAMNADAGKAVWASLDQKPDEWTSQFLANNIERGSMSDYMASSFDGFLKSKASLVPLSPPNVELLGDTAADGVRMIRMRITSPRQSPIITLSTDASVEVLAYAVNQKRMTNKSGQRWGLRYYAIPEGGLELTLELKANGPVTVMATDQSYGLPDIAAEAFKPRPDYMMPSTLPYSDMTLVSKSFTF